MKKFLLILFAAIAFSITASAANWVVTVTTQNQITFKDAKTDEVIGETTEVGRTLTFNIVADTPREAENKALNECQGACDTGYSKLVQQNVSYKGHICNKYNHTVPYSAKAEINTRSNY